MTASTRRLIGGAACTLAVMALLQSGQAQSTPLATRVASRLAQSWQKAKVSQPLRVVSGEANLSEAAYQTALIVVCDELTKTRAAAAVDSIEVLNRSERQGYVYERPAKCAELMNVTAAKFKTAVAANTRQH